MKHTRIKPPVSDLPSGTVDSNIDKTYWHQDEAVLTDDVTDIQMLTVWVAITDATVKNGCMICVPKSHRQGMAMHCPSRGNVASEIFIADDLIKADGVIPLPVKKGGLVLLDQQTIHGSLSNTTDDIRWSFDLRYNVTGQRFGREYFPGFVARSQADPAAEMTDAPQWANLWRDARQHLSQVDDIPISTRWNRYSSHDICA